ncbi:MAG TPA: sialate O-acetylesterase [Opitutaceae bacterium]|nr:sialate O-acetylesterase [Opitutaceae bacterium]
MSSRLLIIWFAALLAGAASLRGEPDPNFHIFLCFGQSNMEGGGRIEERDKTVDRRFQILADFDTPDRGRTMGQWYDAIPPLTRRTRGISMMDYFGRTMVANLPEKYRVGLVKLGVSGTRIELWDKDAFRDYLASLPPDGQWKIPLANQYDGNPYEYLVKLAKIAQRSGVIKGILIHQGESNFEDQDWPRKVKKIHADLVRDLNLDPRDVVLLAGEVVNADQNGEKANANVIMKHLPGTLPNSHVISSAGVPANSDRLHFTADGQREMGRRYAEKMLNLMGYAANIPPEPYTKAAPVTTRAAAAAPSNPSPTNPVTPTARKEGGGRGGPMSEADRAQLAKLAELPPWKAGVGNGDYAISPPYAPAPENAPRANVPKGRVETFHLPLAGSKFYPPAAGRDGKLDPAAAREVVVYIPAGYVAGTPAPLLLAHDAMGAHDREPAPHLPTILDNLIAEKRLPAMVAVMVMPSNQRSLEYDTVSGKYAEFIEEEVLPRVAKDYGITFTKDPNARATLGGSSGGAAALSMAWFHPELYRRVLVYSGTFVNLRNGPDAPHGAWEYHENFIPKTTPNKPLRIWLQVGERDNGANSSGAGMFNWVLANRRMADALKAKGYAYQFVYCKEAGHVDRPARAQTLAPALEWLWED